MSYILNWPLPLVSIVFMDFMLYYRETNEHGFDSLCIFNDLYWPASWKAIAIMFS